MGRFAGKVALVTGAARGIGRGVALALAADGADVVINDVGHEAEATAVAAGVEATGQKALVWLADVSERTAVAGMIAATVRHFGRLDIAVANAAVSVRQLVVEADWADVLRTIEVSQFGVFHTCQMAAQQMLKQELTGRSRGKIIIIGSVHQELAVPRSAAYNMAKAATNHLARTMAAELAGQRINVNVVNPGWIETPGELAYYTPEAIAEAGKRIPWGRLGQPEDIAQAVAFLASDAADYVTGAALRVDGGYVLGLALPPAA
jgi:glucose 1-dehydrogenase